MKEIQNVMLINEELKTLIQKYLHSQGRNVQCENINPSTDKKKEVQT